MGKVAVVTDSNSGITQQKAKELNINVIPMPFTINGKEYFEDVNLTQSEFYKMLEDGAEISTSQPAVGVIIDLWEKLLKDYDEIVHIPMSSGLSGSYTTAVMLAQDYDDRVQVINNQRISPTLKQSVVDAVTLTKKGKSAKEIKDILENEKFNSSIYITVDSLGYLKKGGRVTAAAAAIGTVLNLKPVLQIQGEKLDAYSKARGMKQAKKIMLEAMKSDMEKRFQDFYKKDEMNIFIAHSSNEILAHEYKKELMECFPNNDIKIVELSLSIACHIGPGSLAIACAKKVK